MEWPYRGHAYHKWWWPTHGRHPSACAHESMLLLAGDDGHGPYNGAFPEDDMPMYFDNDLPDEAFDAL